jgi:RNA polymerase sigma factor (sigma-70 family)
VRKGSVRTTSPKSWSVAQLSAFYIEHRSDLISHARRVLKDGVRSEEVVQDALVRVLLASPELETEEHALAYLHKTVNNLCLDVLRAEGRQPRLVMLDEVQSEAEEAWQVSGNHEETISVADDAALIRQAISLLSPAERAALVMWEVEGRSASEIARELGIKESSVRHTVSRARASLRRILSEYIIDEERGLTALDMLSTTYKRTSTLVKKSSKAVMSLILVFFAFLGFNALPQTNNSQIQTSTETVSQSGTTGVDETSSKIVSPSSTSASAEEKNAATSTKAVTSVNAKAATLKFAGLDNNGVPTGFTITDGSGVLGSLYVNSKDAMLAESELQIPWIAKTASGAANVLLSQTITQDGNGTSYNVFASFGREGKWIPVNTRVISTDVERLLSGNYLVTAVLQVKSEVETTIVTPASAGGRDLEAAPSRIVTRILLNSGKTQIVAQAVQVIEKVSK